MISIEKSNLSNRQISMIKKKLSISTSINRNAIFHKSYVESESIIGVPDSFFINDSFLKIENKKRTISGSSWKSNSFDFSYPEDISDSIPDKNKTSAYRVMRDISSDDYSNNFLFLLPTEDAAAKILIGILCSKRIKSLIVFDCDFSRKIFKNSISEFISKLSVEDISDPDGIGDEDISLIVFDDFKKIHADRLRGIGVVVFLNIDRIDPIAWENSVSGLDWMMKGATAQSSFSFDSGLYRIYKYYLGNPVFCSEPNYDVPKVRRVWSTFKISSWARVNPQFISKDILVDHLALSSAYNGHVVEQVILALQAERKIIVFSDKVTHLKNLKLQIDSSWSGISKKIDFAIHGMSKEDLDSSMHSDVILPTFSFPKNLPDSKSIDTVVLASPVKDPSGAVSKALIRSKNKKQPIIVDIRCDDIPICREYARLRDSVYKNAFGVDLP